MTQPRQIRPRATYAIMRRTERRRFLLRPDALLTNLFVWLLGITAPLFDVDVHVAVVMSTHFHLVVSVPNENVSELMHRLDFRLAKGIQVLRRFVRGVPWAPGQLNIVECETAQAVIEAIAYAIVNPVAAGLVYRIEDWPGVTATIEDLFAAREYEGTHPGGWFRSAKWPSTATLRLALPACFDELGHETARALLEAEVERQLAEGTRSADPS